MSTASAGTILVVDDEPAIRELLAHLLSAEGYRVVQAGDGEEAVRQAEQEHPDLVLLDIRMPKMDGMEACQQLRKRPATKNIRIVMLTAYNSRDHLEDSIIAGADDFLGKPINVTELKVRVRAMLKVKDVADEVERLQQYIHSMESLRGKESDVAQA